MAATALAKGPSFRARRWAPKEEVMGREPQFNRRVIPENAAVVQVAAEDDGSKERALTLSLQEPPNRLAERALRK